MNTESAKPKKSGVEVGSDSRARCNKSKRNEDRVDSAEIDGNEVGDDEIRKKVQKTSRSKNLSKSKKTERSDFFTFGARLAFIELRQAFVKAPILHHFDPERHIRVETDVSGCAIGKVLD